MCRLIGEMFHEIGTLQGRALFYCTGHVHEHNAYIKGKHVENELLFRLCVLLCFIGRLYRKSYLLF